jgi:hypothetical protein
MRHWKPVAAWLALAATAAASGPARAGAEPFLTGPPPDERPVVVDAAFHLRDLNEIDDEAETFELSGVLTLRWRDPRQAFDPATEGVREKVYQGEFQFHEVFTGWFPQVVLANESGLYDVEGVLLRVAPDGTLTLTQTLDAVAEAELDLRRYPFDRQRLEAHFEVLGFRSGEVALRAEPIPGAQAAGVDARVWIPQWRIEGLRTSVRERPAYALGGGAQSVFVVGVDVARQPVFMIRLVVFPLVLIVMLSWSVFWMDRSSLGDRINVSFIGILTAVAYQIVVSEILPQISYFTLMNSFLNLSFIAMCATVVINLMVGSYDKRGLSSAGDRVDWHCRWIFPCVYFGLAGLAAWHFLAG